ncbi:MAG: hypothetical protein AB1467_04210 [Candidatus Diapherotrites archaeon]
MKKFFALFIILSIFLILLSVSAKAISLGYQSIVAENGNALVIIRLQGSGTINVPLPEDAPQNLEVEDALYVKASNGIDVSIGSAVSASVYFTSSLLTEKNEGNWLFTLSLPEGFESISVSISLPKNSVINSTSPKAAISESDTSKIVEWNAIPPGTKTASIGYSFKETPQEEQGTDLILIVLVILAVIIIALIIFFVFRSKNKKIESKESKGELVAVKEELPAVKEKITQGQKNLLKAFTENQRKVVELLLNYNGEVKRNQLEKESRISKSSLAATLYQLEQRNVISIDKTNVVHFIRLTDWFKGL